MTKGDQHNPGTRTLADTAATPTVDQAALHRVARQLGPHGEAALRRVGLLNEDKQTVADRDNLGKGDPLSAEVARLLRSDQDALSLFWAFYQVGKLGSYNRAAEEMGTDRPIIRRKVRALEAIFRKRLVTTSKRGVSLTDIGGQLWTLFSCLFAPFEQLLERSPWK